eukprot:COSAG01_NODE_54148_length_334_cov_0.663830_1_plen_42_part_10
MQLAVLLAVMAEPRLLGYEDLGVIVPRGPTNNSNLRLGGPAF